MLGDGIKHLCRLYWRFIIDVSDHEQALLTKARWNRMHLHLCLAELRLVLFCFGLPVRRLRLLLLRANPRSCASTFPFQSRLAWLLVVFSLSYFEWLPTLATAPSWAAAWGCPADSGPTFSHHLHVGDFTVFIFFRYFISILIELDFLNHSFGHLLST
jgi:hypothetical protein